MTDLPLHKDFKTRPDRCELCKHWAQWMQERMLGLCGQSGECTDKWNTCENFVERK